MTSAGSILVVDSRAESRAALVRAVVEADYASLEAATAAEGLALLGSLHPQLVLPGHRSPRQRPGELARQIKLENADVPVLILSNRRTPSSSSRACGRGPTTFW
jgi:CheY-like chemotaxis protein